jgi:signal transduction histidine kinase
MSLRVRVVAAVAYVLLLVIVALAIPLALTTSRRIETEVRASASTGAQVVAASAAGRLDRTDELASIAARAATDLGGRVLILDAAGHPLADSAGPDRADDTYVGRPEVASALSGKSVQGTRHSDTLNEDLLYTAVPVLDKGQTVGAVRLTQSVGGVDATIRRDRLALAGVGLGALIMGLIVAWLVAGTLSRPLRILADTARRIADGDLGARAPIDGAEEQRAVAGAFNLMTDRLVRSLEAQRDFVANASHQLRTPLTGLKLRLEAAGVVTDDPVVQRELQAAEHEADRLARLVTDLLSLAAADAPAADPEPVDLRDAARAAVERFAPRAAAEARSIVLLDGAPAHASASLGDVATALDNLIENALVHTPPETSVQLEVGTNEASAWVAVLDDGPGLGPEDLALAFERFRRGTRRRPDAPGSGLGLAIAGTLAERWGGRALITNRKDGGARAELRLPRDFAVR